MFILLIACVLPFPIIENRNRALDGDIVFVEIIGTVDEVATKKTNDDSLNNEEKKEPESGSGNDGHDNLAKDINNGNSDDIEQDLTTDMNMNTLHIEDTSQFVSNNENNEDYNEYDLGEDAYDHMQRSLWDPIVNVIKKSKNKNQTNQYEQCEYKISKYNSMYSHMRVKHTDLRIKCTECNFSHPFQTKVNTHFKQVHLGQKRPDHRSDICRKRTCSKFYTKNCTELESHAALSCDKCNYSTARSDYLKFHIKSVHDGIIYKCEYCPSYTAYKRKRALTEHILHKHSKTLFTCSDQECKFETQYKQTLKMHTESKHEGVVRYKCDSMNCSYKTNDSKCLKEHSLRDHLKKHSGEKPNKCNQCDYASIRASTLRDHLKKHSGEKSNKCNQCDYASSRADSLRRHLKTHSGEKLRSATSVNMPGLIQAA